MFDITDKVIVVTGGSGVLGYAISAGLAKAGAKVAIIGRRSEKAEDVASLIRSAGGHALGIGADVLNTTNLEAARDKILTEYGIVDVLINGAGGNKAEATTSDATPFFDVPEEALQWVFNLNVLGTIKASQIFGKIFAEKGRGSIINISSMAAFTPLTKTIAYSAAKAAVSNFTRWLAVYYNQNYSEHIRVNALAPGFFLTEQNTYLLIDPETGDVTERGHQILQATPMGRYGKPEELIGLVHFLCSESSSFINGAVIPVDGGFSAFSGV